MNQPAGEMVERAKGVRIGALDNEELDIEELLDIDERLDGMIEGYEGEYEALTDRLYRVKMTTTERKRAIFRREAVAEVLEGLEEQKGIVRRRLESRGYVLGDDE